MTDRGVAEESYRKGLRLAHTGVALAVASAVVAAAAGPGYRFGLWELKPALGILAAGGFGGVIASLLSVVGANLVRRSGRWRDYALGWFGVLIGAGVFMVIWTLYQEARRVPPIHDITTDPANPPAFVALLPERAKAPNGAAYGGAEVAAQQLQAYTDITAYVVAADPARVFDAALASAEEMGWDIVAAERKAGRIEATDTSAWWGFKDDIAIRVARTTEGNARVDVRSVSRVGESDLGKNAERVRNYLAALRARMGGGPGARKG